MKKRVVIVGAGFGGLELAARLSESLRDNVRVTLLDRNDSFFFGFSKLDVLFGAREAADVRLYYRDISKDGVEFRQETVMAIDPFRRRVTTELGLYEADFLVVALGAEYDLDATPGFREGGFEYYSLAGAERLRDVLAEFAKGTVLIGVLGLPFKCPPAPFEGALMLHDQFVKRGVRQDVNIRMTFPMAAPVPVTAEVSRFFRSALDERGIEYSPEQLVIGLDPRRRTARMATGESIPYDLFIGIPVHRAPEVVIQSGLAVDGWVPVNPSNLTTRFPGVYALGDVASANCPKAGVWAETAARVVAGDIAARVTSNSPPSPYEGDGTCYIEFGGGRVARIYANFLGGPTPTARIDAPSSKLAADKRKYEMTRRQAWFGHDASATGAEPIAISEVAN